MSTPTVSQTIRIWESQRGDRRLHDLAGSNGLGSCPAAIRGSAGRHINHESVTADPARIKPPVDITNAGEAFGRGAGRIEISVHVVRGARFRRDLPHQSVTVVEQEHLPPPDLLVKDIPRRMRIEKDQTPDARHR